MNLRQLLKPRYEVVLLYPECGFKLGDIISWDDTGFGYKAEGRDDYYELEVVEHPKLFKRLSWWERRTLEDIPLSFRKTYLKKTEVKRNCWNCGKQECSCTAIDLM